MDRLQTIRNNQMESMYEKEAEKFRQEIEKQGNNMSFQEC